MTQKIIVPAAGESVTEADIVSWYKSSGDYVEMDEPLVELETDKASMDLNAEAAGILNIDVEDGTVTVGQTLGTIKKGKKPAGSKPEEPKSEAKPSSNGKAPQPEPTSDYAKGHPSPAAAKLMAEKEIAPESVEGTGKGGRVTKQDVLATPSSPTPAPIRPSVPAGSRQERREKLSRMRRTIAQRLVQAQQTAALLTTFNEVDMSGVMDLRKKYKESFKEKYGVGLGFMSFFTKAVCFALQEFPELNAFIEGEEIIYHDYCDIGIAVATPKGLVVPPVKNAESMSFQDIEQTILNFAKRARDGVLTLEEMEGGTFSITNGGTFGSMLSTPIVNRPQSGILGLHNIVERPVAVNGEVKIRPIMYVALTYDHRIVDGAGAVRFLVTVKQLIEDPSRLLIGL